MNGWGERYDDEVDDLTLVSSEDSIAGRSHAARPPLELARGTTVGRYVVLDVLGRGAMGVVHAAYDPELDRKVALKLVRAGRPGEASSVGRSQTLREAQAMARLQHPNTVAIYDVGTHDQQVFLTMELVAGVTLGKWIAATGPRPWREVVDVFVQAGRGLAAAHAAGIVHRDFKPDNVLVADASRTTSSRSPRVVVTDFGLARGLASSESDRPLEISGSGVDLRLTRTGRIAGTPAYMAPEVVSGRGADARSDQFSYCVSLYEALYGHRPFDGENLAALALALTQGRIREPKSDVRVPAYLRRVVMRGLCVDPDARYQDMDALLQALLADPARRTRRLLGGSAVLVLVAGTAGLVGYAQAERSPSCNDGTARLRGVWDSQRRAEIEQAIVATGVVYASDTAPRVLAALDRYADAWAQASSRACLDARGREDDEAHAKRNLCLVQRRAELRALVDVLAHADAAAVERATAAVARLPSVDACTDPTVLEGFAAPQDAVLAAEIERLRAELGRAQALHATGRFGEAEALAAATLEHARALEYEPLVAEGLTVLGRMLGLSDPNPAIEHLRSAYWAAIGSTSDAIAIAAAIGLVHAHTALGRTESGHDWAAHAEALARRGAADAEQRVELSLALARMLGLDARFDEALDRIREAREMAAPDSEHALRILVTEADVLVNKGDYAAAIPVYHEALALAEHSLGPLHPNVLAVVNNLAIVRYSQGEFEAAHTEFARALTLAERIHGTERLDVAALINNLASTLERLGRHDEALAQHERALAIRIALTGSESLDVAESHNNLGSVYTELGELDKAREQQQRALEIRAGLLGTEHPLYAGSLANVGRVLSLMGEASTALPMLERAVEIQEAALGPTHPQLASSLEALAEARAALGQWTETARLVERTLDFSEDNLTPAVRGRLQLLWADALRHQGVELERAEELAKTGRLLLEGG